MKHHQPIVNGDAVSRVFQVPWETDDDDDLVSFDGWEVIGRARVEWPGGGLANGLLLQKSDDRFDGPRSPPVHAVVIWERPKDGGAGRFRMVPLGDWS